MRVRRGCGSSRQRLSSAACTRCRLLGGRGPIAVARQQDLGVRPAHVRQRDSSGLRDRASKASALALQRLPGDAELVEVPPPQVRLVRLRVDRARAGEARALGPVSLASTSWATLRATSRCRLMTSSGSPSKSAPTGCWSVATWTSWAVMRTRSFDRSTEPSTTASTSSSRAISGRRLARGLVPHARGPRDDAQGADLREVRDQRVRHAVREVVLRRDRPTGSRAAAPPASARERRQTVPPKNPRAPGRSR